MSDILSAALAGATPDELAGHDMPDSYRAAVVKRSEVDMFEGMESPDKDPRRSLHVEEVPLPELAPDEAYIAVMASSINFNTVWTSIFEPLPTFGFLDRLGKEGPWAARHALDYHVVGSDAAGIVLRTGSAVRNWKVGDKITVHCNYVDDQDPSAHDDSMLAANQRIWGFESNFGGLADIAVVKANQLMPKPAHLSWEEAAINALCNSTAYRMLVSPNGARMTQGDKVLVWGASGGLGSYAVQHVLNGGGTPVGVVSSPEKVKLLNDLGVEAVIDRKAANYRFWSDEHTQDESEWRRFGKDIRALVGGEPEIVFEHPGRQTMGASVFACKRAGTIVTCAATSGYMIEYDNRHLWMKLKTIKGSHFANYREAWDANQLICEGKVLPPLSAVYPLEQVGEAAYQVHHNLHEGKIGDLRRVAGRDGAVLGERGLEGAQRLGRGARAHTLVGVDQQRIALALGHLHRDDLLGQATLLGGCGGPLVARRRERILALPGDAHLLVVPFGRETHGDVVERVGEPVVHHGVHQCGVTDPVPGARARQQVGRLGHRLHAARDDDLGVPARIIWSAR